MSGMAIVWIGSWHIYIRSTTYGCHNSKGDWCFFEPPSSLCCSVNLHRSSPSLHVHSQCSAQSPTERREGGEKWIHDLAVLQCAASDCSRERGRGKESVLRQENWLWEGLRDVLWQGGRKEKGVDTWLCAWKKKNLWGQPIRARVTPLSSGLASKSCAARQPTCLCSMNTWAHTETHGQAKRRTHRKRNITLST